jgi:hypothetical protein
MLVGGCVGMLVVGGGAGVMYPKRPTGLGTQVPAFVEMIGQPGQSVISTPIKPSSSTHT